MTVSLLEVERQMAKRALVAEDKQARRAAILAAAHKLFRAGTGELPTASQVAAATGLAKGTVYIYFETKEEIFATLLLEGWTPVLGSIGTVFDSALTRSEKVQLFIESFVDHLANRQELLQLDAIGATVLERNMSPETLMKYKRDFTSHVIKAGASIDRALRLPRGRGMQILVRSHALARGLWLSVQQDESNLEKGMPRELALTPRHYARELKSALKEYWRGALT